MTNNPRFKIPTDLFSRKLHGVLPSHHSGLVKASDWEAPDESMTSPMKY